MLIFLILIKLLRVLTEMSLLIIVKAMDLRLLFQGLMGGTSNDSTNEEAGGRGSSSNETATSSSSVQTTPKLGYYIVPSYQAASQLSGELWLANDNKVAD